MIENKIVHDLGVQRYFRDGEQSWDELFRRVANAIFSYDEEKSNHMFNGMSNRRFMPNSPTLLNAGFGGYMSACLVYPVEDSLSEIFDTLKNMALAHKEGAGCGFNFDKIRPKGAKVKGKEGVASGVVSFMKIYDAATNEIKQGNAARRGANMGVLSVWHPDIYDFIHCKDDDSSIQNFNLSVMIPDEFYHAVENNEEWELKHGEMRKIVNARDLFMEIVESAHKTADPGVGNYTTINNANPTPHLGKQDSFNACGELSLYPYESCNLASINLVKYLNNGNINLELLEKDVELLVELLDNVIDLNNYPVKEIEESTKRTRKIGIGIMGFHSLLIEMGIPYGSAKCMQLIDELMPRIQTYATNKSMALGVERGVYPASVNDKKRNANLLAIPPTGTVATICGTSYGCEPEYGFYYNRKMLVDGKHEEYAMYNPLFEKYLDKKYDAIRSNAIKNHMKIHGTIQNCLDADDITRKLFRTALEIPYQDHIKVQAQFQKYVDSSISKTISMRNDATVDDVYDAYMMAWKLGCKGITIYRDGCKRTQVLTTQTKKDTQIENCVNTIIPKSHPDVMDSLTVRRKTGCGTLWVTLTVDNDGHPFAVFIKNSDGGCSANVNAIARMISANLRSGVDVKYIIEQLKSEKCTVAMKNKNSQGLSCSHIIGCIIEDYINGKITQRVRISTESDSDSQFGKCPECGAILMFAEGCRTCNECGWSKCS